MPEQTETLSPTDFQFTEAGELVVSGEQVQAAAARAGLTPGEHSTAVQPRQDIKISVSVTFDTG